MQWASQGAKRTEQGTKKEEAEIKDAAWLLYSQNNYSANAYSSTRFVNKTREKRNNITLRVKLKSSLRYEKKQRFDETKQEWEEKPTREHQKGRKKEIYLFKNIKREKNRTFSYEEIYKSKHISFTNVSKRQKSKGKKIKESKMRFTEKRVNSHADGSPRLGDAGPSPAQWRWQW